MKFIILFIIISAIIACCQVQAQGNPLYTGQPGCLTEEELTVALYPHFRNKRAYWKCSVLGQAAALEFCPIAEGFLAVERTCVPWINWYWTPTVAPPSSPIQQNEELPSK
ncbi:hypothetical protein FF38_02765 [Lucilia cuprina]|uniref:Chitin-binding type-2 domain-containing protein n=1 Tax=Lucilia cuprina TaxID=7375 RepID=A0A0L0CSV2_LUCCU|nr:hypothetical protein CVS40_0725 [Lucilia cuprina]KNC34484.1 hypothetical protein FF38_02765 [Lucilia cuprina]